MIYINKKKSPLDVSVGGVFNPSISVLSSVMLPKVAVALKFINPELWPTSTYLKLLIPYNSILLIIVITFFKFLIVIVIIFNPLLPVTIGKPSIHVCSPFRKPVSTIVLFKSLKPPPFEEVGLSKCLLSIVYVYFL